MVSTVIISETQVAAQASEARGAGAELFFLGVSDSVSEVEFRSSHGCASEALRVVLAIAFGREELMQICWGRHSAAHLCLWPSSFYRLVAEAACRSPACWYLVRQALDERLRPWMTRYAAIPPVELSHVFVDAAAVMRGMELAAALWVLVRQVEPAFNTLLVRNRLELEHLLLRRAGSAKTNEPA